MQKLEESLIETKNEEGFIRFGKPLIGEDEIQDVVDTLRSGWIGMGKKTQIFEENFSKYVETTNSVAVNSCTAGLHLGLVSLGIRPGDEVITTPLTFVSTVSSILYVGAKPVLADIDSETLNIDPEKVKEKINSKTKAIIPVHYGGLPCDMNELTELSRTHNIGIVEDAAHAIGARYDGKKIGGLDTIASFSFYPNKNMTTIEGGMVTVKDTDIADKIRILRLHGLENNAWQRYQSKRLVESDLVEFGFKYNFTDVQAALGIRQLDKIEGFLAYRERIAKIYDEVFQDFEGISLQYRPSDISKNRHALHLYVLVIDPSKFRKNRDDIVSILLNRKIGASVHYKPVHLHPFFAKGEYFSDSAYPIAEHVGENIFSLPIYPAMTEEEISRVIETVTTTLKEAKK